MGPVFSGMRWGTMPLPLFSSGVVSHCTSKNGSSQLCQAGGKKVAFSTTAEPTDEEEETRTLSRLL